METFGGINSTPSTVFFGTYTSDEIHQISVKRIVTPTLFDATKSPMVGGLYDKAMGPYDYDSGACETCRLRYENCPGHMGHVELAAPVYHVLYFNMMFRLLTSSCMKCSHFKASPTFKYRTYAKLKLIEYGLVVEAQELDAVVDSSVYIEDMNPNPNLHLDPKYQSQNTILEEPEMQFIHEYLHKMLDPVASKPAPVYTSSMISARHDIVRQFFAQNSVGKCSCCGTKKVSFRQFQKTKIFRTLFADEQGGNHRYMTPSEVLVHFRTLCNKEHSIMSLLWNGLGPWQMRSCMNQQQVELSPWCAACWQCPRDGDGEPSASYVPRHLSRYISNFSKRWAQMFFINTLLVPPPRFRPSNVTNGVTVEHPQTALLVRVLQFNDSLRQDLSNYRGAQDVAETSKVMSAMLFNWNELQYCINVFIDSSNARHNEAKGIQGMRQLMERKEGLFRMHMMGKRVNYACRSVISPDAMLATNQIGIPHVFAIKLTYPEPVTSYNAEQLKEMVINGPTVYPGATHVIHGNKKVFLGSKSKAERDALANRLLVNDDSAGADSHKIVYRHIRDGDVVLMNRQPSLHKPSIMAHKVKVLPSEKTLRMHYTNCSAYNADFDGDEMNVHFPQSELGRAEAYKIMLTDNQYQIPTTGNPLRGLIQDHIVSGMLLTMRDQMFDRQTYQYLLYIACGSKSKIQLEPCILKPVARWSGKQIISSVLQNLTIGLPSMFMVSKSRLPAEAFVDQLGRDGHPKYVSIMMYDVTHRYPSWCTETEPQEETKIIVRGSDLVTGVLDRSQFGATAFGLVHSMYELYGPTVAGNMLTSLSRLFTGFLQIQGFSCGMEDLLIKGSRDKTRSEMLGSVSQVSDDVASKFIYDETKVQINNKREAPSDGTTSKKSKLLDGKSVNQPSAPAPGNKLSQGLKAALVTDEAERRLDGYMKVQLSDIQSKILKLLFGSGQLKPFPKNNFAVMTMTGAKGSAVNFAQVSCMLGQQELEGRRVPRTALGRTLPCFAPYDPSARTSGYIGDRFLTGLKPQEFYFHCMAGREGLVDTAVKTSRSGYLQRCLVKGLESLCVQYDSTVRSSDGSVVQFLYGEDGLDVQKSVYFKQLKFLAMNHNALAHAMPESSSVDLDSDLLKSYVAKQDEPINSKMSPTKIGVVSEKFWSNISKLIDENPDGLIKEKGKKDPNVLTKKRLQKLMMNKYTRALAVPGEPVGVLAAQSIGEPSTQMTLNTFHLAGANATNVTLGIPRLREILMTGGSHMATPAMAVKVTKPDMGNYIATRLSNLTLSKVIETVTIDKKQCIIKQMPSVVYEIEITMMNDVALKTRYNVEREEIMMACQRSLIPALSRAVARTRKANIDTIVKSAIRSERVKNVNDDEAEDEARRERDNGAGDDGVEASEADSSSEEGSDAELDEVEREERAQMEGEPAAPAAENEANDEMLVEGEEKKPTKDRVVQSFEFDQSKKAMVFKLAVKQGTNKVLMAELVKKLCDLIMIRSINGITSAAFNSKDGVINVSGVNFHAIWSICSGEYGHALDSESILSNDLQLIRELYGIEACRASIVREMKTVFDGHGISIDGRHMSLIADQLTYTGTYVSFNRMGMQMANSSILQKASFETSTNCLREGVAAPGMCGADPITSPSASLVVGSVVNCLGTGFCNVLANLE